MSRASNRSVPPLIMGIVNVTPDSFHDGGRYVDPGRAVEHGLGLAAEGADIIDVGGESTRPGAGEPGEREEARRILPVVRELARQSGVPVSIDTRSAGVAAVAMDAGASVVNDVSGFKRDPSMAAFLGRARPVAIAMHMRGVPDDMQTRTSYRSLCADVASELWASAMAACDAGLPLEHLWVDPGIGFSKTADQCVLLLRNLDLFVRLGRPVVVGVSRKSFIGHLLDRPDTGGRLSGTAAAVALATASGARILRVHDVAEMRDVCRVAHAIACGAPEEP